VCRSAFCGGRGCRGRVWLTVFGALVGPFVEPSEKMLRWGKELTMVKGKGVEKVVDESKGGGWSE